MAKFAAASDLFERVVENNVSKVEEYLALGDSPLWRELIRYEFDMGDIAHPNLRGNPLLPKLMEYEIKSLSSFHVAALLGLNDVLMALMEKDVPVDLATLSGTTAFHLACFAGRMDTVNLLREIYKADLTRRDRYGWNALHYASSEGHLNVVQSLVRLGLEVNERDQDGTTPAFRADINGHDEVVMYLLKNSSDEKLLGVDETKKFERAEDISALYAKSAKQVAREQKLMEAQASELLKDHNIYSKTLPNGKGPTMTEGEMVTSAPGNKNRKISDPFPAQAQAQLKKKPTRSNSVDRPYWQTVPVKIRSDPSDPSPVKDNTIRRLIRKELEKSFGEDPEYETPIDVQKAFLADEMDFGSYNIGKKTLTGLMRQEFERYKKELAMKQPPSHPPPPPVQSKDDTEYEDLYASLANLPCPPSPPPPPPGLVYHGPPLPPRNPSMNPIVVTGGKEAQMAKAANALTLNSNDGCSVSMNECFIKLAPLLGKSWMKLAHALPLDSNPSKVDVLITQIEKKYANNVPQQALASFKEWKLRKGAEADIDGIIIALRKSNMYSLIPVVEKVTQEFTA